MNVETCPFIKVEDFLLEIFQICLGPRPSLKENNIADFFRYFQKCQKFDVRRRQFPEKGLRVSVFPLHMVMSLIKPALKIDKLAPIKCSP